jgi:hypothetical protein
MLANMDHPHEFSRPRSAFVLELWLPPRLLVQDGQGLGSFGVVVMLQMAEGGWHWSAPEVMAAKDLG